MLIDVSAIFNEEIIGWYFPEIIAFKFKTSFQLLHTWLTLHFVLDQVRNCLGSFLSICQFRFSQLTDLFLPQKQNIFWNFIDL